MAVADEETSRYRRGLSARFLALASTFGLQVLQVPILLGVFGAEAYGNYLALIAIPVMFTLFDGGLLGASSTRLLQLVAQGDLNEASRVSRAVVTVIMAVSGLLALAVLVVSFVVLTPLTNYDTGDPANIIFFIYSLYATLNLITGVIEGALRAAGHYPFGWLYLALMRTGEFALAAASLLVSPSLVTFVSVLLVSRLVGLVFMYRAARRRAPWFDLHVTRRIGTAFHGIRTSMVGTFAQQLSIAALLQGTVIIVSASLGPTAVVALTATRTMVNALRMVADTIMNARMPSLTHYSARGDGSAAKAAFQRAVRHVAILMTAGAIGLLFLGQPILRIWTHDTVGDDRALLVWYIVAVLVEVGWLCAISWPMAHNRHFVSTSIYTGATASALLAIWIVMPQPVATVPMVQAGVMTLGLLVCLAHLRRAKIGVPTTSPVTDAVP
ncbi:lipopolysaccharide biosynthesis protein [Demequina rhizosphaerae]|uniref:lipopolysaccharide biosynthesis protein n=1 Tax=Demequina rhizosphaerae TaxID=1638985 RepID=UPI000785A45C|nr:hypothetical protein [Demequina rhizosphaerae]